MLLSLLLAACHDAELARPVTCAVTSLDDDTWFGTSLSAERESLHDTVSPSLLDWNVANDLGVSSDEVSLDPQAFIGDEAEACTYSDDGSLLELRAPVTVGVVGQSWVPTTTVDGTLLMDLGGEVHVLAELSAPLGEDLLPAAESVIEERTGTDVASADVPANAWLSLGSSDSGYFAQLIFTAQQMDGMGGEEVPLAETEH